MRKGFTSEQLDMFKRLLLKQRKDLIEGAGRTVNRMTETDRERKLVEKIDAALARIEDGTFGECEECGELISVGRLRARPVTTLCIECKAEQEAAEAKPNFSS